VQITTIKLQKRTKHLLDSLKIKQDSYDATIHKLVLKVKHKDLEKELIKAYQDRSRYSEFAEWENASNEVPND